MVEKRGYTYAEAARYLGISVKRLQRLVHANEIPVRVLSQRSVLFDVDDLEAYFHSRPSERAS